MWRLIRDIFTKLFGGSSSRTETRMDFQAAVDAWRRLVSPLQKRIEDLEKHKKECEKDLNEEKGKTNRHEKTIIQLEWDIEENKRKIEVLRIRLKKLEDVRPRDNNL